MTDGTARQAIGTMQTLSTLIDPSVETLLESHDFAFRCMHAAEQRAQALFVSEKSDASPPWELTMGLSADGLASVSLQRLPTGTTDVSLTITVGKPPVSTLAEAIGMAVSFIHLAEPA